MAAYGLGLGLGAPELNAGTHPYQTAAATGAPAAAAGQGLGLPQGVGAGMASASAAPAPQANFGGAPAGTTGTQHGAGGNFLEGLGGFFGIGAPTTVGMTQVPQADQNAYYLGGSQQAGQGVADASQAQAQGFLGRDASGLNLGGYNGAMRAGTGLRPDEAAYTRSLQDAAAGRGPSAAIDTYKQAADAATQRAAGAAFAGRGGSTLLGARQAAEQTFAGTQQAASNAGIMRQQEMQQAQGALGANLQNRAQTELGRAGLGLNAAQVGGQYELAARGQNDAAYGGEMGRYLQALMANQQGGQAYNAQMSGNALGAANINAQQAQFNAGQQDKQDAKRGGLFSTGLGIATGGASKFLGF